MSNIQSESEIVEKLRAGLQSGAYLNDGRVLPERKLAETLDISRARLRRALDTLEQDGVIFRHHGQGTFAAPPPAPEAGKIEVLARQVTPQNLMEVRLEVEPALAALAATRASSQEIEALRKLMSATLRSNDRESYDKADDIFHFKIAEMAHNPLFLTIYQSIRAVRRHATWTNQRKRSHSPERIARLAAQHELLVEYIASRDSAAAARQMEEHLVMVSNVMLRDRMSLMGALRDD